MDLPALSDKDKVDIRSEARLVKVLCGVRDLVAP